MTWVMGQSAPSASMRMTQNQVEGLIDQMVVIPQVAGETKRALTNVNGGKYKSCS